MYAVQMLCGEDQTYMYCAEIRSARPEGDYTPRALPRHHDVNVPMEAALILWQR